MSQGICRRIDAFDASLPSLAVARDEAARDGYASSIRYFAADFNRVTLPRNGYDAVFFHQSLHHVAYLERLFLQVWRTLRPGGTLYLDEYVGPSRFEWNDERIESARAIYRQLPPDIRRFSELPLPIIPGDPSEAVRSSHIVRYLRMGFTVIHERPYGGAILAPLYSNLHTSRVGTDLLEALVRADADATSKVGSHHTVFVATPKSAPVAALVRYRIDSKLRRLAREVSALLGSGAPD